MPDTYVIIGAGQAGANAAIAMRQAGFAGRIILVGEEGVLPYERPPLSKEFLLAPQTPALTLVRSEEQYGELDIMLHLGAKAETIDTTAGSVRLQDGTLLPFDRLLLATGGRSRRLSIPGGEHVHYLRTLKEALALRGELGRGRRVVSIGAGVIGLEFAASAAASGSSVTVIEAASRAMERCVPEPLSEVIEALHLSQGVRFAFEEGVVAIERSEDGTLRVHTRAGHVHDADLVVAGVGLERDLALAENAGLHTDGGILVDEFGETSTAGIYAAGDVATFFHLRYNRRLRLENWRHAQNHGIAVGRAMAGLREPYVDLPYFWTDQHGMHLQVSGFAHEAADTLIRGDLAARDFVGFHLDSGGRLVGVSAANRPRDFRAASKLLEASTAIDTDKIGDSSVPINRLAAA
jgi:NADPH-dependent 2,4-dienoyl-CoA reductase/sulfur reductase-like enzyme